MIRWNRIVSITKDLLKEDCSGIDFVKLNEMPKSPAEKKGILLTGFGSKEANY
jgi:hypothetical protein